jgi:predicted transcriptional regulator YdeE
MGNYNVIQKPAIVVVGIECRTSNSPDAAPQDIPRLWDKFYKEKIIDHIPNKVSYEVIALYCDYESDYTKPYSLIIGCPVSSVDSVPAGMRAKIIPAGSYAIFPAVGENPPSVYEAWLNIWQTKLKRTYTGDYELYGNKSFSGSPKEVEIFIAIE